MSTSSLKPPITTFPSSQLRTSVSNIWTMHKLRRSFKTSRVVTTNLLWMTLSSKDSQASVSITIIICSWWRSQQPVSFWTDDPRWHPPTVDLKSTAATTYHPLIQTEPDLLARKTTLRLWSKQSNASGHPSEPNDEPTTNRGAIRQPVEIRVKPSAHVPLPQQIVRCLLQSS